MRQRGGTCFFQSYASGALRRENLEDASLAWLDVKTSAAEDAGDFADDLDKEWGVDPTELESIRAVAEDDSDTVYLWRENRLAFDVFVQCKFSILVNPDGKRQYMGITAREIAAAMWMLNTPKAERADVLSCVRICESAALPHLNKD